MLINIFDNCYIALIFQLFSHIVSFCSHKFKLVSFWKINLIVNLLYFTSSTPLLDAIKSVNWFLLTKFQPWRTTFFNYNKASTMIDIRLQAVFLIHSLQFGTAPINSIHPVHSAHSNHDPTGIKSSTISEITPFNTQRSSHIKSVGMKLRMLFVKSSLHSLKITLFHSDNFSNQLSHSQTVAELTIRVHRLSDFFMASKTTSYLQPSIQSILLMVYLHS